MRVFGRASLLVAVVLGGCGDDPSPTDPIPARPVSAPYIASDPTLSPYFGTWMCEGNEVVSVVRQADGSGMVVAGEMEGWDSVVNNIRIDGKSLLYDQYNYFDMSRVPGPRHPMFREHPFSGVKCEMELNPGANKDQLISCGGAFGLSGKSIKLTRRRD